MYSVTKRIDFCYGHRLLDYDGICKHPHGHNAIAEIEVRTGTLDNRNMVCDFSDIKRIVKGWIDRELDHKMVLRQDDPLVKPLQDLGEPIFLVDSNPTVERIARLIFDYAVGEGLPVMFVIMSIEVYGLAMLFAAMTVYFRDTNKFLGYGAELAAIVAEDAFDYLDGPVSRIAGPDVPGVPYNHVLEDWFMVNPEKIADGIRTLAAY